MATEYTRLKEINVAEHIGGRIYATFIIRNVDVRTQKDKSTQFINMDCCDCDVQINAKLFGATPKQIEEIIEGYVYRAAVDVKTYDKSPSGYSLVIYNIERSDETTSNYMNWAKNLDVSGRYIVGAVNSIMATTYGKICYHMLNESWRKMAYGVGGKSMHHTEFGGLMVHTAEVLKLCLAMAEVFNTNYGAGFIDTPLLVASAVLHDICKTEEFEVNLDSGSVDYSTESIFLNHSAMALRRITEASYKLGLGVENADTVDGVAECARILREKEQINMLCHCVSAHHGKLEWGALIAPSMPEAFILHMADYASGNIGHMYDKMKDLKGGQAYNGWVMGNMERFYKDSSKE